MNGVNIISTVLDKKSESDSGNHGSGENSAAEEEDAYQDSAKEGKEVDRTKPSNKAGHLLTSAPTTKCRVHLKDVIDLVGSNNNDIQLISISTIEQRY